MEYNIKGVYNPSESYVVKDVVPFISNGITQYYFCLQANSPDNPQSPSPNGDTAYWGLINALSNFPNSVDTFITKSPIQYNDIPYLQRYQELKLKSVLTTQEQIELDEIFQAIRSKLIIPEDFNRLQQSITNMQMFLNSEIVAYLNSVKADLAQTVVDAIQDVEDKRVSMINYLDTTEVGALKNDVGDLNLLQTRVKDNLVNAVNELKNEAPVLASLTQKGIVQLNDGVDSSSIDEAATANALRRTYDIANNKYSKPIAGIPYIDLSRTVQTSLDKADTALQSISNSVSSTSSTVAASSSAVKQAYDLANNAIPKSYRDAGNGVAPLDSNRRVPLVNLNNLTTKTITQFTGDYVIYEDTRPVDGGGVDTTWTLKKQCVCNITGTLRVTFGLNSSNDSWTVRGRIYINDIPVGIERLRQGTTELLYTEDFTVNEGDRIQIYMTTYNNTTFRGVTNTFRISKLGEVVKL